MNKTQTTTQRTYQVIVLSKSEKYDQKENIELENDIAPGLIKLLGETMELPLPSLFTLSLKTGTVFQSVKDQLLHLTTIEGVKNLSA